jgi:hypothetical protein
MTIFFCLTTLGVQSNISVTTYTRFCHTTNSSASNVGWIYQYMGSFINKPSLHERMKERFVLLTCNCIKDGLSLSLMLRPMVSRPVCLGIKHPSGAYDQILLLSDSCGFVDLGRSLSREDGSVVYNCCWASPAQSFSNLRPWNSRPYFTV